MSKRIKIVGNALVVEDTITGVVEFDRPSKDLWYNTKMLEDGTILFVEREGFDVLYSEAEYVPLSDAVDIDDVSFTSDTFRAFVRANMGFNIAGSAALKTNFYESRVIADGGTIVNLPAVKRAIKDVIRNQPSLMLIPSGVKAGKLYSALQGTAEDFTVDRDCLAKYTDEDGILKTALANVPRIEDGAILVEPQATNFIHYSEDFSNSAWQKVRLTVDSNVGISPDGTQNADLITKTEIGSARLRQFDVTDGSSIHSSQIWIKRGGVGNASIRIDVGTNSSASFPLTDQWQLIKFENKVPDLSRTYQTINFEADIGDTVLIYGYQVEQASTASSYIPTAGVTETRLVDNISVPTPAGVTSITETINGVEQTPITTIPVTYSLPVGNINKIVMQ